MRALSNNMQEHSEFLSTPKFVSDLLFLSDSLRQVDLEGRNEYLKKVIMEINKGLPNNVYVPIAADATKHKKKDTTNQHRVLRISLEHAFCLHSKERAPYHIIVEVAYAN